MAINRRQLVAPAAVLLVGAALLSVALTLLFVVDWGGSRHDVPSAHDREYFRHMVDAINSAPDVGWRARYNPYGQTNAQSRQWEAEVPREYSRENLHSAELDEYDRYLDRVVDDFTSDRMQEHLRQLSEFASKDLPKEFNAREKWPHCRSLFHVPNQGGCGSCFATAAMTVASDRACIASNGSFNTQLSIMDALNCCSVCGSCFGGEDLIVLAHWVREGVVTGGRDGCRPYTIDRNCGSPCSNGHFVVGEKQRVCRRECQHAYSQREYEEDRQRGAVAYVVKPFIGAEDDDYRRLPSIVGHFNASAEGKLAKEETRDLIRKEIFLFGSVTASFQATEEFTYYASGTFHPYPLRGMEERWIYGHAVRLIGWGHDAAMVERGAGDGYYWIAVNSYGEHWGDLGGLFHIDLTAYDGQWANYSVEINSVLA